MTKRDVRYKSKRIRATDTHCTKGHAWADPETNMHIRPNGSKVCNACERYRHRERRALTEKRFSVKHPDPCAFGYE